MEYYALINNVNVGPHRPEELVALGMTRDTLVWRQGMTEWMPAWRLPELDCYFPHPLAPGSQMQQMPPCPPSYLAWSIIVTLLCCQLLGIIPIIYSASVESRYMRGDYEGANSASRNALYWIIGIAVVGFLFYLFWFLLQLLPLFFIAANG